MLSENHLVSIIIPTYKRAVLLERAIDSVLKQTYSKIEIIVVDDNDPESVYRYETRNVMRKYKEINSIIYVQHDQNKNGAAARNTGLKYCSGEYIGFLDDDDYFLPDKIAKQVLYLNNHIQYDGVYCGRIEKKQKIVSNLEGDLSKQILSLTFTPTTPSLLFRKAAVLELNGFNSTFDRHQDFEFLLRYFMKYKLGVVKEILVVIGQNEGENSLHAESLDKNKMEFLTQFKNNINDIDLINKGFRNQVYIAHYVPVFWDHMSEGNYQRAIQVFSIIPKNARLRYVFELFRYVLFYLKIKIKRMN